MTMRNLENREIQQISGGHSFTTFGLYFLQILELPHIFMGLREFVNYSVDFYEGGCNKADSDDHFTQFFCRLTGNPS